MATPLDGKSTTDEIKERFDHDVERFSNLTTGQSATVDAPLAMELITRAAFRTTPDIRRVLDIGCGAGNNTLKLSELAAPFDCDLVDLSLPMLKRARARVAEVNAGRIRLVQGDIRTAELAEGAYDVVIAAAVLHHLRDVQDWEATFAKVYRLTAPGGSFWITDLVSHEIESVEAMMWEAYGSYLSGLGGQEYRQRVLEYIDREDSPRPLTFQVDLLRRVGFARVDILHKNSTFAAFGAVKAS